MMIPAYLYGTYLLYEVAVFDGFDSWTDWAKPIIWILVSFFTLTMQIEHGTDAMYFLRENPNHADNVLFPSLFYLLNWVDHTPRENQNDNQYYY